MSLRVQRLFYGEPYSNVYLLTDEGGDSLLIDFSFNGNHCLEREARRSGGRWQGALLTHGHIDHIHGLLSMEQDIPIYIGQDDVPCLEDPELNVSSSLFGKPEIIDGARKIIPVSDGEILTLLNRKVRVIATPFHTKGSVCYYFEKDGLLFTGDTLFHLGFGRYDLPGSCPRFMDQSLSKLRRLPRDVQFFPGHGPAGTLGVEFDFNPAFR